MINIHPFTPAQTTVLQPPESVPAETAVRGGRAPSLTVSDTPRPAAGAEDVTEAVEADCARRDDAIGRLISAVFQYPAPPMPEFR